MKNLQHLIPITTKRIIPAIGPKEAKIAIVGEAPGANEETEGKPFVGASGRLLQSLMFRAGMTWGDCYVTNVIKERPPKNDIEKFLKITKTRVEHRDTFDQYVALLKEELKEVNPNVVLAVGNVSLYALTGETGITSWRGSIMESSLIPGLKVIPTIHPAAAIRMYMYQYYIFNDIQRMKEEARFPYIKQKPYVYLTNPRLDEALDYLEECKKSDLVGFDIEVSGFKYGLSEVSCISFSHDYKTSMCIPFTRAGNPRWSLDNEKQLWDTICDILQDEKLRKIAQNKFFDTHFLFRRYGIVTKNCEDTMIAQAILRPDFPKSLDFINSMYTDINYYKADGKEFFGGLGNEEIFWTYNAKDSIVLSLVWDEMEKELKERDLWKTYRGQNDLVEALVFMSEHGMKLDTEGLVNKSEETKHILEQLEARFYNLAGKAFNLRSNKQLKEYFYGPKSKGNLGLPAYKNKGKPTLDESALIKLSRPLTTRPAIEEARILLEHRKLSKLRGTYYEMSYDEDGRIRSSMNPVGTRFGRLSSSQNIFGTGANLQNQPYALKEYFLVDEGHVGYEIDLSQAENRIVAYVAPEPKLIEAFEKGIDIHRRTASYIFKKHESEISDEPGSAPQFGSGEYSERFWGKKGNHAFNYDQSANAFSEQMLISRGEAQAIYNAYHNAYAGIKKYHNLIQQQLQENRTLTNLFGRRYTFLDRWDYNLFKAAYAFIPQSTIADIINQWGIIPLYEEYPEVVLLNQIHDSIVFEIPVSVPLERHAEIILEISGRLSQPLTWRGRSFTIPCELKICKTNFMKGTETKITDDLCQTTLTEIITNSAS